MSRKVLLESNNYGDPEAFVSLSGRTRVTVDFDERGRGTVSVARDNFVVQRIDLGRESNIDE